MSFLGHVGVLAWLGFASDAIIYQAMSVQQGHASIQLKASMESAPQQATTEQLDPVPFEMVDAREDPLRPTEEPLTPTELELKEMQQREVEDLAMHDQAVTVQVATAAQRDLLALQQQMERAEATQENTPKHPAPYRPLARKALEHPPILEMRVQAVGEQSSVASRPSPASRASDGADSAPSVIHNPAPIYPRDAMLARQTGRVLLRVELAADGSVVSATVYRTSGVPSLDAAALRAVRQWRFSAANSTSTRNRIIGTFVDFKIDES